MWEDFLEPPSISPCRSGGSRLEDHAITIVPSQIIESAASHDDESDSSRSNVTASESDETGAGRVGGCGLLETEDDGSLLRFCALCGKRLWSTQTAHDEEASHMTRVRPRLFLGGAWNAWNTYELSTAKVDTIVSMASEIWTKLYPNSFRYKHYALEDDDCEFVLPSIVDVVGFLQTALSCVGAGRSGGVLVHCAMGRSRSVTAVVAYVMWSERRTADDALLLVQRLHPAARPNPGYKHQLDVLEILFTRLGLDITKLILAHCPTGI